MNQLTLHEAIIEALKNFSDNAATAHQIASYIRRNSLYQKQNGDYPDQDQINARVSNHGELFNRISDHKIKLI